MTQRENLRMPASALNSRLEEARDYLQGRRAFPYIPKIK